MAAASFGQVCNISWSYHYVLTIITVITIKCSILSVIVKHVAVLLEHVTPP